jgi:hypothetical protein
VLRGLRLVGLVLWGISDAIAQSGIDLAVTPAWDGWSRPGRATEVAVRLRTGAATRARLDIVAGRQTVHTELDLEPGRGVRLHVPVGATESLAVTAGAQGESPQRRDVVIAQSESPLLGAGLATDDRVHLEGFHTVTLDADDLPRNASAYSSIDALILDAPTLGALDERQLGALLAHTAACGRTALVDPDPRARRVLEGAAGCGGRFLMSAASLSGATDLLRASLAEPVAPAISLAALRDLARPDHSAWNRALVVLAVYFGAAVLVIAFSSSILVFLLVPALAGVVVWTSLHTVQPASQLLVWGEADSGARVARYQAWQRIPGNARSDVRVPVLPQLASVRSCDASEPMRFHFDATRGSATSVEFGARLFRAVSLCYSGNFPVMRAIEVEARPDGVLEVRNDGAMAWPKGVLLAGRLVHDLPALAPDEKASIGTRAGKPPADAAARAGLSRTPADGLAALWELDLGSVAGAPTGSAAWLLVAIPPP